MRNVTYVGALAALLEIDLDTLKHLLEETFGTKKALIESNLTAIQIGYDYAREHFECPLPTRLSRLDKTADHIMIDGNTAAAFGCIYAGATVGSWYPITPSTSLFDAFGDFCKKFRTDEKSGTQNYWSSKRKTNWLPLAWRSEQHGMALVHSHRLVVLVFP
ncbi:MAG: hypothetical protein CM1200mP41_15120 [Gammaproteobacteria bacterium]|nr:MAG: hypothetical protein CM1200mP41_15120 [Gammaproteobacteria bacterium]